MEESELKKKRLEFLEDTVKYYSEDTSRRAIADISRCEYNTKDGKKCAIGRHIPDDKYNSNIEGKGVSNNLVFNILPYNIKMLGIDFLQEVQCLHDGLNYWNESGVTEKGYDKIESIKIKYIN